jgi:hypothetical protein
MKVVFVDRPPRDFIHPCIVGETLFVAVHKIQSIRCFPDSLGVAHPRTMESHGLRGKEAIVEIPLLELNEVFRIVHAFKYLTSKIICHLLCKKK